MARGYPNPPTGYRIIFDNDGRHHPYALSEDGRTWWGISAYTAYGRPGSSVACSSYHEALSICRVAARGA